MATETSWAQTEFGQAQLGDKRLTQRLVKLAEQFEAQPFASIPQACGTWANTQAAYDFFDNDKVEVTSIVGAHRGATVGRMTGEAVVLAVQDTVYLNYTTHPSTLGLGPIGTKAQNQQGLVMHVTEAVTPSGVPLGLLDAQMWARGDSATCTSCQANRPAVNPQARPIEEKESYKWLAALYSSVKNMPPGVQIVSVCDRESDIFEYLDFARHLHARVVIRAAQDRKVESDEGMGKLWDTVLASPVTGTLQVHLSAREGQPAREAQLQVRYTKLKLVPPARLTPSGRHGKPKKLRRLPVWAVLTLEVAPPEGTKPISWLLLTTIAVNTFPDACERIAWYAQRWKIEVFFDLFENGCKVEDRRLRTDQRLMRCLAVYLVVAARLQRMTFLARRAPDDSCLAILSTDEWQALYCFVNETVHLPEQPPTLRQALRWVAQLGGFLGRKGDGEPGIRTIWRGWQRLQDLVGLWRIVRTETCE